MPILKHTQVVCSPQKMPVLTRLSILEIEFHLKYLIRSFPHFQNEGIEVDF